MSIRVGTDFYNIPEISSGHTRAIRNTGASSNLNSNSTFKSNSTSGSFASELSSSIAALNMTGTGSLGALNSTYGLMGNNLLYNSLSGLYPGLSYNTLNASNISQLNWGRNDFPLEALFGNGNASSILNWIPQGTEPASNAASVLDRLNSTLGMKAVVISPELESKLNDSPQLMQDVMNKISNYIKGTDEMFSGKDKSDALILDGNGNISHYRTFVKDTGLISPAETEFAAGRLKSRIHVTNSSAYRFLKNNGETI